MKKIYILIVVVVALAALAFIFRRELVYQLAWSPTSSTGTIPTSPTPLLTTGAPTNDSAEHADVEVVTEGLSIPWEIVWLPGGDMLVTERPGRLLRIGRNKQAIPISGVAHVGEGGLLGMALHPQFAQNNLVYLYLTTRTGSGLTNRVERYTLQNTQLQNRQVILENIPGAQYHDGGRIAFGPDGLLYITTGDAGVESNAQDTKSLAGKILRVTDTGNVPADNPFNNEVFSYGHRNSQGLAWDAVGNLWSTEHGRSGVRSGFDEVNLITAGANYGWPEIEGDETQAGMTPPAAHSGASTTWAPGSAIFWNGSLWFAGLRGEALYQASLNGKTITNVRAHLAGEFGRLRTVALGPDGGIYLLTSNQDGRGNPKPGDDKIVRIDPSVFE